MGIKRREPEPKKVFLGKGTITNIEQHPSNRPGEFFITLTLDDGSIAQYALNTLGAMDTNYEVAAREQMEAEHELWERAMRRSRAEQIVYGTQGKSFRDRVLGPNNQPTGGKSTMNNFITDRLNVDELVALSVFAGQLSDGYASEGLVIPSWLDNARAELRRAIADRRVAELERERKNLEAEERR